MHVLMHWLRSFARSLFGAVGWFSVRSSGSGRPAGSRRYLDKGAFAVVEGGVAVTQQLLRVRWDYIMFTGSEGVGKIVLVRRCRCRCRCRLLPLSLARSC